MLKLFFYSFCTSAGERNVVNLLNNRVQLIEESVIKYCMDIEHGLYARLDNNKPEEQRCGYILKGFNQALLQQIGMLDNSNLASFSSFVIVSNII